MRKKYIIKVLPSIVIIVMFLLPVASGEEAKNDEEASKLLKFAQELLASGDYYRAITEFKRFISYYPDDSHKKDAKIGIADSYFKAEKWQEAIDSYRSYLQDNPEGKESEDAIYNMAVCFIKMKQLDKVRTLLSEVEQKFPSGGLSDRIKVLVGKSLLEQGYFEDAEKDFEAVNKDSTSREESEKYIADIKGAKNLNLKSPALAGLMSAVLPGAGQLYTGRKKDAAFSFFLNGLFTWGAIEAFNRDIYVAGAILSFFELGWYSGNIYNAVSNAYKYNDNVREEYFKKISLKDHQLLNKSFSHFDTPGISLQVKF